MRMKGQPWRVRRRVQQLQVNLGSQNFLCSQLSICSLHRGSLASSHSPSKKPRSATSVTESISFNHRRGHGWHFLENPLLGGAEGGLLCRGDDDHQTV